jgi:hypothetical protein
MSSSTDLAAPVADAEILSLLEKKIDGILRVLTGLREERNALRLELEAQMQRCRDLETGLAVAESGREALRRLETERDALARERAGIARRIEGILERLEQVGLE